MTINNFIKPLKLYFFISIGFLPIVYAWSPEKSASASAYYKNSILTETDAAAFALLVYHDKPQPSVPVGFTLLCQCPLSLQNKNYYGEAYYRLDYATGHHVQPYGVTVVIVHRGSILSLYNIVDDFLIAFQKTPDSFLMSSKLFTDYVSSMVYEKFPHAVGFSAHQFFHVGHSLGAIHAELNYVYQREKLLDHVHAIVFESPGSKEIMERLMFKGKLADSALWWAEEIKIINADINVINSFNQQVSMVARISPGYNFINIPKVDLSPVDLKYFATLFTLDQHSMEKIYNYFMHGGHILNMESYPVGIMSAFRYYKNYYPVFNKAHRDYWDQVLQVYWDRHHEIHAKYNNSESNYREYIISHYLLLVRLSRTWIPTH